MTFKERIENLKKELYEKRELISDMEIAGCEDNESQILYKKTKKRIHFLKSKIKGIKEGKKDFVKLAMKEIFQKLENPPLCIGAKYIGKDTTILELNYKKFKELQKEYSKEALTAKELFTLLEDGDLIKDSCKNILYIQLKKRFIQ